MSVDTGTMSAQGPRACSNSSHAPAIRGAADLLTHAQRSRALLEDLSAARDDVLAPVDLNRILRLLLSNQAALLAALAEGAGQVADGAEVPLAAEPAASLSEGASSQGSPLASEPTSALPASLAEQYLGVRDAVSGGMARIYVEAFDHRDNDFEKGLDKLNRWTEGTGGTPFQVREDRAYLNLGSSAESAQRYEKNLMERMGFSRRIGRLVISGLEGEVVVYERP